MSYADEKFIETAEKILSEGTMIPVRPHWKDGTQANVKKIFDIHTVYDLSKGEFPAISLRFTNIKKAINEILWIYQSKSNNIKDLDSKIWDEWEMPDGTIGLSYGYQIKNRYRTVNIEEKNDDGSTTVSPVNLDQTDFILHEIKHNPNSRRIITDMYNIDDLSRMSLDPCAFLTQWNVRKTKDTTYLDMILYQRSQDFFIANNWNVCQYAALLIMIAKVNNMVPGKFTHQIADCHIYDRHIPYMEKLIKSKQYDAPTYTVNNIDNFYDFKETDIIINNYKYNKNTFGEIPVAI